MTGQDGAAADPFARALFAAVSLGQDLRGATKEAAGAICFSELAHCLLLPAEGSTDEVLSRAFGDPKMAPAAEALLRRIALVEFPAAAAASGGGLEMREHSGVRLRLAPSLAVDGPTYLLMDRVRPERERPRLLVAIPPGARPEIAVFPEAETPPLQIMFDAGAPFLRAFRNPDSRLYLT